MVQINDKEFGLSVRNKLNQSLGITTLVDSSMDINNSTLNIGIGTTAGSKRLTVDGGLVYDSAEGTDLSLVNLTVTGYTSFDSADGSTLDLTGNFSAAQGSFSGNLNTNGTFEADGSTTVKGTFSARSTSTLTGTTTFGRLIQFNDSAEPGVLAPSNKGFVIKVNNGDSAAMFDPDLSAQFHGAVTIDSDLLILGTGYLGLPAGSDSDRPSNPQDGWMRWSTTQKKAEIWDSDAWIPVGQGGGFFKGNNGSTGDALEGPKDIFRINENFLATSITIDSGENASCTGPLSLNSGVTLTINGVLTIV